LLWTFIIGACVVFLASIVLIGGRSVVLMWPLVVAGIFFTLFLKKTFFKFVLIFVLWVALLLTNIYVETVFCQDRWQFGQKTPRSLAKKTIAELVARSTAEKLGEVSTGDNMSYEKGVLVKSPVWKKYQPLLKFSPNFIPPEGYFIIFLPERQWHSWFTGLFRIQKMKAVLYYNGGKLSEPGRVSLKLVSI